MRLVLPIALSAALFASSAFAEKVVLMVNMNYSSDELKVVREQATARGQRVEMVPPESMIKQVEPMFADREKAMSDLQKQFPPRTDPDPAKAKRYSDEQHLKLKAELGGILRGGTSWNTDPKIAAFLGADRIKALADSAQKVAEAEKKNGDITEQLRRKAIELRSKGDVVDSVVFSSHSDGSNLTGETSVRLSASDLYKLRQEQPSLFDSARHVLLLGCYNMTKPNHRAWRYDLFPNASMLAGFGIKAPSRYDPTSTIFIRQTMGTADRLDREMAAAGKPLDAAYIDKTFKELNSFTTKGHPGVVDYCFNMVEGQPETWTRDCNTQWKDVFEWKRKLEAYWSLVRPQEDPPTVSGGDLRTFYNHLQGACPAKDTPSQQKDAANSERMRVTMREMTIRLIFWWNVQSNFSTYNDSALRAIKGKLLAEGIYESPPALDGKTSRLDFVGYYNNVTSRLREKNSPLLSEFQDLFRPLYLLKGEDTVSPGEKVTVDETLKRGAIPFNWIEGTTVMRKK